MPHGCFSHKYFNFEIVLEQSLQEIQEFAAVNIFRINDLGRHTDAIDRVELSRE